MLKKSLSFLICFFLFGCIQSPQFSYQNTDYKLLSFQEVVATSRFTINNPNLIPLKGIIDYNVELNGNKLFSGETDTIDVGSQAQADAVIETKLNLAEAFGALSGMVSALNDGQSDVPYKLAGNYRTTMTGINLSVPLQAEGKMALPKLPKIELQNVSVGSLDLQTLTLKIRAKVNNANSVPLTLDKLAYALSSGSKQLIQSNLSDSVAVPAKGSSDVEWQARVNISSIDKATISKILSNPNAISLQNEIQNLK